MVAGCSLAILFLRTLHRQWDDFGQIALMSAIPNVLTAALAFLLFRKKAVDATGQRILLIACYLIGIGGGVYFYFT